MTWRRGILDARFVAVIGVPSAVVATYLRDVRGGVSIRLRENWVRQRKREALEDIVALGET